MTIQYFFTVSSNHKRLYVVSLFTLTNKHHNSPTKDEFQLIDSVKIIYTRSIYPLNSKQNNIPHKTG